MTSCIAIENAWRATDIGKDLKRVRNVKPLWSNFGTVARRRRSAGSTCGLNTLFGFSLFGTLKHGKTDCAVAGAGGEAQEDRLSRSRTAC